MASIDDADFEYALALRDKGRFTESRDVLQGVLARARKHGNSYTTSSVLHELGLLAREAQDSDAEREFLTIALQIATDAGLEDLEAIIVEALLTSQGELSDDLAADLEERRKVLGSDDTSGLSAALRAVNSVGGEVEAGRIDDAEAGLRRALAFAESQGLPEVAEWLTGT